MTREMGNDRALAELSGLIPTVNHYPVHHLKCWSCRKTLLLQQLKVIYSYYRTEGIAESRHTSRHARMLQTIKQLLSSTIDTKGANGQNLHLPALPLPTSPPMHGAAFTSMYRVIFSLFLTSKSL